MRCSNRRVASIHEVVAACHERRVVGQQKADEWRDLIGAAQAAQRVSRNELLPYVGRQFLQQRRVDVGRTDAVDPQTLRPVFGRGVLR